MTGALKTHAIVLLVNDFGESNKLVTFYTLENGKLKGVAKGAKRSQHRFVNALEPFTWIRLAFIPSRTGGLGRIDAAEVESSFPCIRSSAEAFCMASLCAEMVDKWTRDLDPHRDIFHLFLWYLRLLQETDSRKKATLFFKVKLLSLAGYAPNWAKCSVCNEAPVGRLVYITLKDGGFICENCGKEGRMANHVSVGAIKTLHHIQNRPLNTLERLNISDYILNEAWGLTQELHSRHLHMVPLAYKVLSVLEDRRNQT